MKKPTNKDKRLAPVLLCEGYNHLEKLGLIKTQPDGINIKSTFGELEPCKPPKS